MKWLRGVDKLSFTIYDIVFHIFAIKAKVADLFLKTFGLVQWLMPVIPALLEAGADGS